MGWKPKIMPYARAKPVIYDQKYGFLHLHRQSFPEDYGSKIQAIYLKREGLEKGNFIEKFLKENSDDPDRVFSYLEDLEHKLDRRLKLIGIKPEEFGQEFINKINFLGKVKSNPSIILKNLLVRLIWPIIKKYPHCLEFLHIITMIHLLGVDFGLKPLENIIIAS